MKFFIAFCAGLIISTLVTLLLVAMISFAYNYPTNRNCRQGDINGDFPPPEVCIGRNK